MYSLLRLGAMPYYIVDMIQQFQIEVFMETVRVQKAEKVRLNEELCRKDVESNIYLW